MINAPPSSLLASSIPTRTPPSGEPDRQADPALRQLDQLLWTEMLRHAGFEDALSRGSGESASAFTRYVVEDIARDLAEAHPLVSNQAAASSHTLYNILSGQEDV